MGSRKYIIDPKKNGSVPLNEHFDFELTMEFEKRKSRFVHKPFKIIVYTSVDNQLKKSGTITLDAADFLNTQMTVFNSSEKLQCMGDRKCTLHYQLKFDVRDEWSQCSVQVESNKEKERQSFTTKRSVEVLEVPDFLKRSSSKRNSRGSSRHASPIPSHVNSTTYNSEYRRSLDVIDKSPPMTKTFRANTPAKDSDFSVCPKYLPVSSDYDDLQSTKSFRRTKEERTDSSEKRRAINRPYVEDKLEFIQTYNDLVLHNKIMARELNTLKKKLGFNPLQSRDTDLDDHPSANRLGVKPQDAPQKLTPLPQMEQKEATPVSRYDQLIKTADPSRKSPSNVFQTIRNNKQTGNSSIQFNLSPSIHKTGGSDIVAEIEEQTRRDHEANQLKTQLLSVTSTKDALQIKLDQLALDKQSIEGVLKAEIDRLQAENNRLLDESAKLKGEINELKYSKGEGAKANQGVEQLLKKMSELEEELARAKSEQESTKLQLHLAQANEVSKSHEIKRLTDTNTTLEKTLSDLQLQISTHKVNSPKHSPKHSPKKESKDNKIVELELRLEELIKERDQLHKELQLAKTPNNDMPRLKRSARSFQQLDKTPIDTEFGATGVKKSSAKSVIDGELPSGDHKDLSLAGDDLQPKEKSLEERIKEIEATALNIRSLGSKDKPAGQLQTSTSDDPDLWRRLVGVRDQVIAMLKTELKNQTESDKNQIDALIKEKEELQLELHRKHLTEKDQQSPRNNIDYEKKLQEERSARALLVQTIENVKKALGETKAQLAKSEYSNNSLQALHKNDQEKIRLLDEDLVRTSEDLKNTKQLISNILNTAMERHDVQLIEKIERVINYDRAFLNY
jgi:DNA repair exonuclease SbcCD ATPase subunit